MQVNGSFNHNAAQATGGCYSDNLCLLLENCWRGHMQGWWDEFRVHGDGRMGLGFIGMVGCI